MHDMMVSTGNGVAATIQFCQRLFLSSVTNFGALHPTFRSHFVGCFKSVCWFYKYRSTSRVLDVLLSCR